MMTALSSHLAGVSNSCSYYKAKAEHHKSTIKQLVNSSKDGVCILKPKPEVQAKNPEKKPVANATLVKKMADKQKSEAN